MKLKIYYNDKFPQCIYIVHNKRVYRSGACSGGVVPDCFTHEPEDYWYCTPWGETNWYYRSLKKYGFIFVGSI